MFTTTRRLFLGLLVLAACGSTESNHKKPAPASAPAVGAEVGYFAGGCFWGVEHFLEQLPGVLDVESGYMGGGLDAPTYEQVSSGDSGHAETVRVTFDPQKIGYEAVARRFFEIHDPTEIDRQGPDVGTQYRSAVFVTGPEQRAAVDDLIARLKANGYAVATTVEDAGRFWPAEEYHQNYYVRTRKTPYCHMPVPRFDQPARS
ncbi:peptide-methionine (S)-S-oxide reductase MsrA [Nannocystis pusilla]|uniref:Peptide methionine sulfoxide reductase MsrA n=1 Tax=Nannocystis pusilla TaxID=889268 RepID=A0ABS7U3T9_9BACT|nr:peptide-methionine (S)-S-oxide reductase MsrA [Nannocystis pusilla]MBZ5715089.1 peptide-methionine (S)-S-oxide reductase MsrA [Nannocystis pusilla]